VGLPRRAAAFHFKKKGITETKISKSAEKGKQKNRVEKQLK
jgi:hypothetical protein